MEPAKVRAHTMDTSSYTVTDKEAMLYALGLGFSTDPLREDDYKFTYELADGFTTFPTFSCVAQKFDLFKGLLTTPGLPRFNPMMLLHGEQTTEVLAPMPPTCKLLIQPKTEDI